MRGLATLLASILKAALAAASSFAWRWCSKTGKWIQDRVVAPAVDYTADAACGALAGITGFIPNVLKSAAKLPGHALRGTGAAIEGGGKFAGASLKAAAAVPGALANGLASGLAGGGGGMMPPPPAPDNTKADRLIQDAVDVLEQRRLMAAGMRRADQMMMRRSDVVGEAIHQYASAVPSERTTMDLSGIPDQLQAWLLTASPEQLARLAAAGPVKCGLMATGHRTGIVGLDMPTVRPEPMLAPLDRPTYAETVRDLFTNDGALATRIATAKGIQGEWHPAH